MTLVDWDRMAYGDDYHTAEDVASEVFCAISGNREVLNLRPDDTLRHTLITHCKRKHRDLVMPWRKGLVHKVCDALIFDRISRKTHREELREGYTTLVINDLLDRSRDGGRSYLMFSPNDLDRWRIVWEAGVKDPKSRATRIAQELDITEGALSISRAKVNTYINTKVKNILAGFGY